MSNPYLLLWLEAPLQSWGHDSKFGRRDTLSFPTKSGILGLVCCALGAGGEQCELLAKFSLLNHMTLSFVHTKKVNGGHEPRDPEPLLKDFHMVGAGYDLKDPWQKFMETYKSNGKPRESDGGGTKMTYRYYLQDAVFAVIMEVPEDMAKILADALQNPVWDLYLGRKNCAPTDFIFRGLFGTQKEAQDEALIIAKGKKLAENFRVLDGDQSDKCQGEVFTLNDVPVQFGENKQYRDRFVTVVPNDSINNE